MKHIGILFFAFSSTFIWSSPVEPPPVELPPPEGSIPPPELAPNAERDLSYYHEFSNTHTKTITVYEGLPHHGWEREIYEKEKKEKEWIEIGKYPFYSDERTIKGKSAKKIQNIILDKSLFEYYGGPKFCGGFHPDYAIKIDSVYVQICFGCHEMKLIDGTEEYIVDMKDGTKDILKKALSRFRKHRPKGLLTSANQTSLTTPDAARPTS